ncbi:MAG: hypothetical protein JW957_04935 [Candidatus Omnitrophica bacterium]|nr:hypothetical protein [Candidatus Omnitrophota bacterium]
MNRLLFTAAVLGILLAGCETCVTTKEPVKTSAESAAATVQPAEIEETAEDAAIREQKAAAEKIKDSLTKGEAVSVADNQPVVDAFGSPYAKYRMETGDIEIWFYDDFYLVFDKDAVSMKDYELTIPAVN